MEQIKELLENARNNVEEAIEILKEEHPTEITIQEELREEKIKI